MTCPECRWSGRAISAYRPRPSKEKVLICPSCYTEVKKYVPPAREKKLRSYTGAMV